MTVAIEAKDVKKEETEDDVLDLTLPQTRRLIKIPTKKSPQGETLEMRLLDDFGIIDQQHLLSMSRRFEKLWNAEDELTENEQIKLEFILKELFNMIVDAPKAVKDGVADAIRGRVVTAFTLAPLLARQEQQAKEEKAAQKELTTES